MQFAAVTSARPTSAMPPMASDVQTVYRTYHSSSVVKMIGFSPPRSSSIIYLSRGSIHSCCAALQEQAYLSASGTTAGAVATMCGHIELVIGPMFAGKSSELLRRVDMYESQGLKVAIIKSNKDTRYSESHVVTHNGTQKACFAVPTLSTFRDTFSDTYAEVQVIAIDEAQFFSDLSDFCIAAARVFPSSAAPNSIRSTVPGVPAVGSSNTGWDASRGCCPCLIMPRISLV